MATTTVPGRAQQSAAGPLLGAPAIVDLEGQRLNETLGGHVVLLDFWATWCAPCLEELPRLRDLEQRYGHRGLRIVGVSVDQKEKPELLAFLRRHRMSWPQVYDGLGLDGTLARHFEVEAVPRTLLFDRQGRLIAVDLRGEALEAALRAIFAQEESLRKSRSEIEQ